MVWPKEKVKRNLQEMYILVTDAWDRLTLRDGSLSEIYICLGILYHSRYALHLEIPGVQDLGSRREH